MQFRIGDIVALFGEVIDVGGKLKIIPHTAAIEDEVIIADPSDIRLMRRAIYLEDKVVYNGQTYEMMHVLASKIALMKRDDASEDDVEAYAVAHVDHVHHADQTGLERLVSIEKAALLNNARTSSQALPSPAPSPQREQTEREVRQIAVEPQPKSVAPASIAEPTYETPAVAAPAPSVPQPSAATAAPEQAAEAPSPQASNQHQITEPAPAPAAPVSPPLHALAFDRHTSTTADDTRGTQPVQSGETGGFADFAIQTNDNAVSPEDPDAPKESLIARMHRAALGIGN